MRLPIVGLIACAIAMAQAPPSIVYVKYGGTNGGNGSWPSTRGYLNPGFDPVTGCMFIYAGPSNAAGSGIIYSSDEWLYCATAHDFTKHYGGNIVNQTGHDTITSVSATNPVVVTITNNQGFMGASTAGVEAGQLIQIINAAGNGCSGLNGSFTVSSVNFGSFTVTLPFNATTCSGNDTVTGISATFPAVLTLSNSNGFVGGSNGVQPGASVTLIGASGTGCSGFNSEPVQVLSSTGNTITVNADARGCSYTASSASISAGDIYDYGCLGYSGQPSNRHPGTITIDPVRRTAILYAGLNDQTCGSIVAHLGIWSINLDGTPPVSWTQINSTSDLSNINGGAIYDPDDDVNFMWGGTFNYNLNTYVFCVTNSDPTMTAKQVSAGCTSTNVPIAITDTTGIGGVLCTSDNTKCPMGIYQGFITYDSTHKKALFFGGSGDSGASYRNDVWSYNIPTHAWTEILAGQCDQGLGPCGSHTLSPPIQGDGIWIFDALTGYAIWHDPSGLGAPGAWGFNTANNTWTQLSVTGAVPQDASINGTSCYINGASLSCAAVGTFDSVSRKILVWGQDNSDSTTMWEGQLSNPIVSGKQTISVK